MSTNFNLVKATFIPVNAMKAQGGGGRRGIAPFIRNLGARWRRVVSFTSRPLYAWRKSPVPNKRKLSGSQSQFGRCG